MAIRVSPPLNPNLHCVKKTCPLVALVHFSPPSSSPNNAREEKKESAWSRRLIRRWTRLESPMKKWVFLQVQRPSNDQYVTKRPLVHVVEEGETLTSISKKYGVSIEDIAASNSDIVDVDFILKGQPLDIPLDFKDSPKGEANQKQQTSALSTLLLYGKSNLFTAPSFHKLQAAKSTGFFLLLVPLIAFCIRCIIGTFRYRAAEKWKHQSRKSNHGPHMRWKSILDETRETEDVKDEPLHALASSSNEYQPQESIEEFTGAYNRLEPAYLRFLSECGMGKWGYWRGGSTD